jgi:hypothetical protein
VSKKFHFTYRTTRPTIDQSYYFGIHSTDNLHDGYLGSGLLLNASVAKHGREAHHKEILQQYPTRVEAAHAERQLVTAAIVADPLCLNLSIGGETPFLQVGSTRGCRWMHMPTPEKELQVPRDYVETYLARGWQLGRHPTSNWITGTWWVDETGKQRRGNMPEGAKPGRLNGTSTGRQWVVRDGRRQLVVELQSSDVVGFSHRSNKGCKVVVIDGKRRVVPADQANTGVPPPAPTTGRIGLRSPDGVKRLVSPTEARELVKAGWVLATTQLRSAPPQVLELAAELGLPLPAKRTKKST